MKHVRFLAGFAAGCATVLVAATAINSQDPPTDEQIQEVYENFINPGPEHERLAQRIGTWNFTTEFWMAPGTEAASSTGTAEYEMWMGGRYLVGRYNGDMMGQPFEGAGCTAYDRVQKKYVSAWIDNMGTGIMVSEGKAKDAAGKVVEYLGTSSDPFSGGVVKLRTVEKEIDNNNFVMEMYGADPTNPAEEFLTLKITYVRAN